MKTSLDQVSFQETRSLEEVRQSLSHQMRDRNRVGLGWLRFSCSVKYFTYWKERIEKFFRIKLRSRGKGWQGYIESWEGGLGILIAYTPVLTQAQREAMGIKSSTNEGKMTLDIPQSALDSLTDRKHLGLWIDIFGCEDVKFTRVDIYYDDYGKIISPEVLHRSCLGGGVGVPRFTDIRDISRYNLQTGKSMGYTVYIGSCKSDRQIRYYDKTLESEGKQDCYRMEMQDSGQYAEKFGPYMLEVLDRALQCGSVKDSVAVMRDAYKSLLKGSISFHEIPEGVSQKDLPQNWAKRSPHTWWWEEMMAGLEPAKLTLDRVEPSLQKSVAWFINQVAPTLAVVKMVYQHYGMPFNSWFTGHIDKASDRLGDKHLRMIEEAILTSPAY